MNHFKPQRLDAGAARVEHLLDREYGAPPPAARSSDFARASGRLSLSDKTATDGNSRRSRFNAIAIAAAPSLNSTMLPTG